MDRTTNMCSAGPCTEAMVAPSENTDFQKEYINIGNKFVTYIWDTSLVVRTERFQTRGSRFNLK